MISFRLARRRTFYIEDYRCTTVDILSRNISPSLDQDLVASIAQLDDERKHILLRTRPAPRHFDKLASEIIELRENVRERDLLTTVESVFAVAPDTPQRTARQPHKRARPSGMRRLALDRQKYFRDAKIHRRKRQ